MTQIVFRELPGVATVERQLDMHFRDHLLDDEVEELPHLIDETSVSCSASLNATPSTGHCRSPVRGKYRRADWEASFDVLGQYTAIQTRTGAPLTSTFAANKAADCIASKCSGGSWFAPSTGSTPKQIAVRLLQPLKQHSRVLTCRVEQLLELTPQ